ncbi:MAG: zinc metallopeptidase [Deltaproteobacteria bacterium]|nr:zinc metallopeptidase [Deltaproteobacteria bacterium]
MFYFDPLYLLVTLVALAFSGWATFRVKSAFARYSQVPAGTGYTGAQVARKILDQHGLQDVPVEPVRGFSFLGGDGMLSDHYDPRTRVIRLSPGVYDSRSVAAQAIAAHEVGHAIQHATGYAALALRNAMAPVAMFGSNFSYILIFLGIFLHAFAMVKFGILLFTVAVIFQFITLPVEIDASARAKRLLPQLGLISPADSGGVSAVLNAAAWTYVAAAAAAVLNLLYLLLRTGLLGGGRSED